MFCKRGVLRNLAKFTEKHLWQSLFFNKVAGLIEKETLVQVFSYEICQIYKDTFSYGTPPMAASDTAIYENSFLFYGQFWPTTSDNPFKLLRNCLKEQMFCVLLLSTSISFFEIPLGFLFFVIAFIINFAQKNKQNNRSLNVWLALNVGVVYNSDSTWISI